MVTPRFVSLAALVAATGLLLTACDIAAEPQPTPSETVSDTPATAGPTTAATPTETEPAGLPLAASGWPTDPDGAPVGWQLCQAPQRGLAIRYPAGWSTANSCGIFEPGPILPGDTVIDLSMASTLNQTAAGWLASLSPAEYVVLSEPATVDGLAATRYELTWLSFPTTTPPGSHRYGYLFERGNQLVDVHTVAVPTDDYAAKRYIVDQAATTIAFLH